MVEVSGDIMVPLILLVQHFELRTKMAILTARERHCVGEVQPQQY